MPEFVHLNHLRQYTKDAEETSEPWLRWQYKRKLVNGETEPIDSLFENEWIDALGPIPFNPYYEYRRKPQMIRIGEFDVPEPVREPLEYDQEYWLANPTEPKPHKYDWSGDYIDLRWLAAGLIHLTEEAAQIHIDALRSFTRRGE